MTALQVLASLGLGLERAIAELDAAIERNPDAAPAYTVLKEILTADVTVGTLKVATIQAPKEVLDWLTKPATDVIGDDSDQA